eukprot:527547-Pyramimonas_sp.AAC.1
MSSKEASASSMPGRAVGTEVGVGLGSTWWESLVPRSSARVGTWTGAGTARRPPSAPGQPASSSESVSKHTFGDSMAFGKSSVVPRLPQVLTLDLFVLVVRVFDVTSERLAQVADGCVQGLDLGL